MKKVRDKLNNRRSKNKMMNKTKSNRKKKELLRTRIKRSKKKEIQRLKVSQSNCNNKRKQSKSRLSQWLQWQSMTSQLSLILSNSRKKRKRMFNFLSMIMSNLLRRPKKGRKQKLLQQ